MRRTMLKWLHWSVFFLLLYFLIVEPEDIDEAVSLSAQTEALATHAGMGLILALLVVIWLLSYWRDGPAGKPGPKLPPWARRVYGVLHRALYWALPVMLLSGALTGLVAPFPVEAFGAVPLNFGLGDKSLHEVAGEVHELVFNALTTLAFVHILFHLWRHYLLRDNALRIMAPKALHRWL